MQLAFLICSAILSLLVAIAAIPQFNASNTAVLLHALWSGGGCLAAFLNCLLWRNDVVDRAPAFCDFTVYFTVCFHIGVTSATLAIARRLHIILTTTETNLSSSNQNRWLVISDVFLGFGVPVLFIPIYYVNAGHRYDILEEIGCLWTPYPSVVSLVTLYVAPLVMAVITAIYGAMNVVLLRRLFYSRNRGDYSRENNARKYPYTRLILVSAVGTTLAIPLLLFFIIHQSSSMVPWVSWKDTHSGYSRIGQYAAVQWRQGSDAYLVIFSRWLNVICATIWLVFFSVTPDTARVYGPLASRLYRWLRLTNYHRGSDSRNGNAPSASPSRAEGTAGSVANWFATIGSRAAVDTRTSVAHLESQRVRTTIYPLHTLSSEP